MEEEGWWFLGRGGRRKDKLIGLVIHMTSCVCFAWAVGLGCLGLETQEIPERKKECFFFFFGKQRKNANALMEYRKVFSDRTRQEIPVFFFFFYLFKENKII